jgi:hypothetical protein
MAEEISRTAYGDAPLATAQCRQRPGQSQGCRWLGNRSTTCVAPSALATFAAPRPPVTARSAPAHLSLTITAATGASSSAWQAAQMR